MADLHALLTDAGRTADLTPTSPAADLAGAVNRHRDTLLAMGKDIEEGKRTHAERLEAVERMQAETAVALKAAKAAERVEWQPGGDAALLDARFMLPDGSVRFGARTERVVLKGFPAVDLQMPGLLTDERPVTREHQTLTNAFRGLAIARELVRHGWDGAAALESKAAAAFMRAFIALPGRVGAFCRAAMSDGTLWERVINGSSGTGGELISNPTINQIRRPLLLQRRLFGMIPSQVTALSTFKQPIITGHGLLRKRGATSDDPARFPSQRFTTSDASISVVDMVINALLDPNWVRDAAQVLGDPIAFVQRWLDEGTSDTMELALLHGDTAATHEDTLSTWTLNGYYTAGQLDGTDSPAKFWIGARARAFDDSNTGSGGGSFTASTHYAAVAALGNHADKAVMVMGLNTFYTGILANTLFTSYNAMGPAGTLITGKLGAVGQNEIIISEFMPKEFDTSSGLYTGSNKGHEILYTDPTAWMYYELADGSSDYDVSYPERGARYVGMTHRGVLVANVVSTEKPSYVLYNAAT